MLYFISKSASSAVESSPRNTWIEGSNSSGNYTSFSVLRRVDHFSSKNWSFCTLKRFTFCRVFPVFGLLMCTTSYIRPTLSITPKTTYIVEKGRQSAEWFQLHQLHFIDIILYIIILAKQANINVKVGSTLCRQSNQKIHFHCVVE